MGVDGELSTGKSVTLNGGSGCMALGDIESGRELDCGAVAPGRSGRVELVLAWVGEHAEVYVDGLYRGTAA